MSEENIQQLQQNATNPSEAEEQEAADLIEMLQETGEYKRCVDLGDEKS